MSFILNALWRPGNQTVSGNPSANDNDPRSVPPLAIPCAGRLKPRKKFSCRTTLRSGEISLMAWPSHGGLIVLSDATPPDFDFLGLDALDPPLERDADQESEDRFCRELLRLGATWWDSLERFIFVLNLAQLDEDAINAVDSGEQPTPTRRERRWVRVAWPSEPKGSLYVLEHDAHIIGFQADKDKNPVPKDAGRVALARTMDERCLVLKRLGATLYDDVGDYRGLGFLRAWEDSKDVGEVGALVKTVNEI